MIHATLTLAEVPPPPKLLQEDDTFGLVAESMPDPVVPKEIQLTSYNFRENTAKFDKTAVIFCVRCKLVSLAMQRLLILRLTYILHASVTCTLIKHPGSIQCKVFLHQTVAAHNQLQLSLCRGMLFTT